jgi:hypothetical protein
MSFLRNSKLLFFVKNKERIMKQVLIVNRHPDKQSYNYALSEAYLKGAGKTDSM